MWWRTTSCSTISLVYGVVTLSNGHVQWQQQQCEEEREKYNLLDLLNIIMYIRVYAQASRFSMACVGVAQRERPWLIAGLPIELRTAQHVQHKLSLLCHLAFAVLAHLPFSVPAINGTINCFQLQSQSKQAAAGSGLTIIIICTLNTLKTSRGAQPSRLFCDNCPMYLLKFVTFVSVFILFVFVSFFDSVFIVFNLCRMHCALALNPTSI